MMTGTRVTEHQYAQLVGRALRVALVSALVAVPVTMLLSALGSEASGVAEAVNLVSHTQADALALARDREMADEASVPTPSETELFGLVNRDRERNGLARLDFDPELLALARERATAQQAQPQLSHRDENGQLNFAAGLAARGIPFNVAAENLARVPMTGSRAPEAAEAALMNSEPHRAIILHAAFDRLAIGSSLDTSGRTVFAQIFRAIGPQRSAFD